MLVLVLHAGPDAFAVPAIDVQAVVPRVTLRKVPAAPAWVAGMMVFRGAIVPVVDLVARVSDRPAQAELATRIAVVRVGNRTVGVLAESVTHTTNLDITGAHRGLDLPGASFLGEIALASGQMVQVIRAASLLPDDLLDLLFRGEA